MTPMGGSNHTIDTVKKLYLDLDEIMVTEVNLFLFPVNFRSQLALHNFYSNQSNDMVHHVQQQIPSNFSIL